MSGSNRTLASSWKITHKGAKPFRGAPPLEYIGCPCRFRRRRALLNVHHAAKPIELMILVPITYICAFSSVVGGIDLAKPESLASSYGHFVNMYSSSVECDATR